MRTLKELWQVALDNYDINQKYGICRHLGQLLSDNKMTWLEYSFLSFTFYQDRPFIFSKFFWNNNYSSKSRYWWTQDLQGNIQRKKFMEHLVNKYSK